MTKKSNFLCIVAVLIIMVMLAIVSFADAAQRIKYTGIARSTGGAVLASATVSIYLAGTTTAANVYEASSGGASVTSVTTDAYGRWTFYADIADYAFTQQYKVVATKDGYDTITLDNIYVLTLPTNSAGYLQNDGSGNYTWGTGGGDILAAGNNTFTGTNIFTNTVSFQQSDGTPIASIPTAAPTSGVTGLFQVSDAGVGSWLEPTANCFAGGVSGGTSFECKTTSDTWALMWTEAITATASNNQLVCFDDNGETNYKFKACGLPNEYTEPSGTLKAICDTGTLTTGACDPTAHPGGFSSIEVGHATDTTIARSSAGVITIEGVTSTRTIASGTATINPGAVSSGSCSSAIDGGTATGVATTDVITWNFNADPTSTTGWQASATVQGVFMYTYPTSDHVNFKVCNNTGAAITPGSLTVNWKVFR